MARAESSLGEVNRPALDERHGAQFGVIGLGNMGENLALNVESHGYRVALWNHKPEKVDRFLDKHRTEGQWVGSTTLEEFVRALARPRQMLLMVPAGKAVDEMLEKLTPLLSPGDVVIDGGNSLFADTQRREAALRARGLHFIGMGVSGGAEGARFGPSLMPGGPRPAYDLVRPILEAIAAKTDSGPCVTYVGPDGAGHFVKMVHNGIEYGNMQLIAESYDLLRQGAGLSATELSDVFADWNRGPLASYLIEITSLVLKARDPETGQPMVDLILDHAEQKGTGRWTAQAALDLGVPVPTIAAAVDARVLSSMKAERVDASRQLASSSRAVLTGDRKALSDAVQAALAAATICSYAQGMNLLRAASFEHAWHVDRREIARIWKGGCIIRARLLDTIMHAFERAPDLPNLLLDADIRRRVLETERGWRSAVQAAVELGVPIPAMSASLGYFDGYRSAVLPQNLTQAQRDFFGAHTYQRVDRPGAAPVHTDWRRLIDDTGHPSQDV
jgi:6-phosphogluconate dehydrogenase